MRAHLQKVKKDLIFLVKTVRLVQKQSVFEKNPEEIGGFDWLITCFLVHCEAQL